MSNQISFFRFSWMLWNFLPHYLYFILCQGLGILKQKFPNTPVLALTATATASVKEDVVQALGLENCIIFRQSFNRPNLWWVQSAILKIVCFWKIIRINLAGILSCPRQRSAWRTLTNSSRKIILMNVVSFIAFQEWIVRKWLKNYRSYT